MVQMSFRLRGFKGLQKFTSETKNDNEALRKFALGLGSKLNSRCLSAISKTCNVIQRSFVPNPLKPFQTNICVETKFISI